MCEAQLDFGAMLKYSPKKAEADVPCTAGFWSEKRGQQKIKRRRRRHLIFGGPSKVESE